MPDTEMLKAALESQKQKDIDEAVADLREAGKKFFNKDYNPEVDRKVSKQLIALYARLIPVDTTVNGTIGADDELKKFIETITSRK